MRQTPRASVSGEVVSIAKGRRSTATDDVAELWASFSQVSAVWEMVRKVKPSVPI